MALKKVFCEVTCKHNGSAHLMSSVFDKFTTGTDISAICNSSYCRDCYVSGLVIESSVR